MTPRCKFVHNLPCEQVSMRITELEDENARLRSCLSDDAENARLIMGENEELRELVSDMFEEIEADGFDPMVERQGKRGLYYEEDPSWRVGIKERVQKLGIEVE